MADSEQALQDDTGISRALTAFGVDTPMAPPWTGDGGGQTLPSEYFLHFKVALVPQEWTGSGHSNVVWLGHCLAAGSIPGISPGRHFQPPI